jgi:glycerophosphoryl diester phosphodiesterase
VDTLVDDSLLRIYQLKPDFSRADGGSGQVLVEKFINLSDPNKLVPFPIKNGQTKERILTAEDFDTESLVVGQDGSFWVGDEYGPFLLHFSSTGVLLQAPIPTPNLGINGSLGGLVQSPNNPLLNNSAEANLRGSRGFESIAYSPDRRYLYPMLEATVNGDPADSIRIYQYDTQTQTYADKLVGLYQLEDPGNTPPFQTGDLTPINNHEFLVIERDDFQGDKAFFKKVFKIDISQKDANGFVQKEEVIDLLSISDPQDLNKDGEQNFSLPITSIEDILVLNPTTVLVAVDNNFPFPDYGSGRPPELDNNEMILVGLDKPLNLDLALGQPTPPPPSEVFGTPGDDDFDSVLGIDGFIGKGQNIFTSSGNDTIDVSQALGGNRIDAGSGDDLIFAGTNNRILAGSGADRIFLGYPGGNNVVTGGSGADRKRSGG